MIYKIFTITVLFILLTSCSSTKVSTETNVGKYFKVEFVQNKKVVPILDKVVTLNKRPFKFRITYYDLENAYISVSSSWGKYYYDYPDDKNIFECNEEFPFEGCRFVAVKTAMGGKYNVGKSLGVGDGDYQWNWFYNSELDWHRFDKDGMIVKDGVACGEMTVENIYDCDARDSGNFTESEFDYRVDKIDKDIYMVFATNFYKSGMDNPKELQREKFILRFR